MLNTLTCEAVRLDDGGLSPALYPVSILDVNLTNDQPLVFVKSEEGWMPERWYPLEGSHLFEPPPQRNLEELKERLKTPGCPVEALYKVKQGVPAAWYRGVVVSEAKGIYAVDLQLVPARRIHTAAEQLRLVHDPQPLTRDSIERVVLPVPPNALEETTNERQLQLFAHYGHFEFVQYDAQINAIVVLVYGKSAAHRAQILYQFHTLHAHQRQKLRDEIAHLRNDISGARVSETGLVRCEFSVPPERFVDAIGGYADFPNLTRARHIDGIVRILADDGRFVITAKNEAAMNEAREILDIVTEVMYVDQPFVGQIIGKQGVNLQSMIKTTAIMGLFIHDSQESARNAGVTVEWKEGFVVFVVTGSRAATEAAKMLIEYQLDHNRQLEEALGPRRQQQSRRGELSRQATEDRISTGGASTDNNGKTANQNNEQRAGERQSSQPERRAGDNSTGQRFPQPEPPGQRGNNDNNNNADNQNYQENDNRRRSVPNGRPDEAQNPPRGNGGYRGRGRGRGGKPGMPPRDREERRDSRDAPNPADAQPGSGPAGGGAPQMNGHADGDRDQDGFKAVNRRGQRSARRGPAASGGAAAAAGPAGDHPDSEQ